MVDELKRKAGEQSVLLAEKQAEADTALREITISMQVRSSLQWWIQGGGGSRGWNPLLFLTFSKCLLNLSMKMINLY